MSGVTGLRTSEGKSRMLGESMSGFRGELLLEEKNDDVRSGLMFRFLSEFLRS